MNFLARLVFYSGTGNDLLEMKTITCSIQQNLNFSEEANFAIVNTYIFYASKLLISSGPMVPSKRMSNDYYLETRKCLSNFESQIISINWSFYVVTHPVDIQFHSSHTSHITHRINTNLTSHTSKTSKTSKTSNTSQWYRTINFTNLN